METPSPTINPTDHAMPWRGFHHVALVTPNLEATIRFYVDVLGMQAGEVMDRHGKHCFIKPGDSETWGLHVFETPEAQIFPYPDSSERFVFIPGALQHIAFALPDEKAALVLRERLTQHGVRITGINELGPIRNFLFVDNNGTLLEATWPE
jgi:catechol 2,3-dioxygenase-like lactoylglutathione lyase family enzyme